MRNKTLAILIIAGSFVTAVFIVGINATKQKTISLKNDYDSLVERNTYAEEIPEKGFKKENTKNTDGEINLTALLAEQIAVSFSDDASLNLLKESANSENPESPEEIANILGLGELGIKVFELPKIDIFKFRITEDQNPSDALKSYSINFDSIIKKYGDDTVLSSARPDSNDFKVASEGIQKIIDELYKINVPKLISEIHAKQVSFLILQKEIYIALSNIQTDPVKALIGLEKLPLISEEISKLKKEAETLLIKNK